MTIVILGGRDDEHAVYMLEYLRARRADVELLDSSWFPRDLGLRFDPVADTWTLTLPGGRRLAGEHIRSIYWRCYNGVQTPPLPDHEQAYIASNDARGLFESFLIRLPVRWVNGWQGFKLHQTKPVQLAMVAELGMTVPATTLTNDPEAVRDFAARHPRSIFKPVQGGAHTRPVTPAHLTDENLKNLAYAPVTLQEEVVGTNIRVFVAGTRVLPCEVQAETLDFRDTADPRIVKHELPADMEEMCLRIAAALDLVWTGIDLRLTGEGLYVFLEANPSPMFLGFQRRCGLPLTESLAELLLNE
jgi:glutathione synthase/RimK-type ligase-like ATP-grasp enzyme